MPFSLKHLLCGINKEDDDLEQKCRPVEKKGKKNYANKKNKKETITKADREHSPKPDERVSSQPSIISDGIEQLIQSIPDPGVRENFRQWQTECILEQVEKDSKDKEIRTELEEKLEKAEREKTHLQEVIDVQNKENQGLKQDLEDVREELKSTEQELQKARTETTRLESIVSHLQDKPYVPQCRRDSTNCNVVEALGKLALPLQEKQRQDVEFSQEVKSAIRLVEQFIGPRWKEFAREIDLPLEIIEDNDAAPDKRQSERFWRIVSEWQKRENITVSKIATVCQQLDINICLDKPMSGKHKRVLDKNREQIFNDITPKPVLYHMLKYLPIPASLQEYVTSTDIRHEMAERLLNTLPLLGDQAFPVFTLALTHTGQDFLADLLFDQPMPKEHNLILQKFENTVIRYSDSSRLISGMARYVTIPGCIHRYLLEPNITKDSRMKRLLEVLPCFGHTAMDILIKTLDDTGCKQVSAILKDKTGELQKLLRKDAFTQMSQEEVDGLAQEARAPLTGHRRSPRSRDTLTPSDISDTRESDELLFQDDHYTREMMTKEMEANAAMYETTIEQQVNLDYRSPKPIEILKHMDRVRVRYTTNVNDLE